MGFWDLKTQSVVVTTVVTGPPGPNGVPTRTRVPRTIDEVTIQQVGTTESVGAQVLVTDRYRVSCQGLEEWISERDAVRVSWSEDEFHVEGRPAHLRSGVLDHTEFIIVSAGGGGG